MKPDPVMQGFYRTPMGNIVDDLSKANSRIKELEERIQLLLEGDTLLETTYKLKTKIRSLEEEVSRLRGESPDAGGKSLQRGKRHFSAISE